MFLGPELYLMNLQFCNKDVPSFHPPTGARRLQNSPATTNKL